MVLSELKEVIDIHVPGLEVNSKGSLSLTATLVDKAGSVIEDLKHRNESVSISVGSANVAVDSTNVRNCQANSTCSFRNFGDLFKRLKYSID